MEERQKERELRIIPTGPWTVQHCHASNRPGGRSARKHFVCCQHPGHQPCLSCLLNGSCQSSLQYMSQWCDLQIGEMVPPFLHKFALVQTLTDRGAQGCL